MFGEMALLTDKPRAASVVALEATACAVLRRTDFELVLREQPNIALGFARVLADRLSQANERAGIDFVTLSKVHIDPRVLMLLPPALVNAHNVLPIGFSNNRLTLAMVNPSNIVAFDDVRRILKGVIIEPTVVTEEDFKRFVASTYTPLVAKADAPHAKATPASPSSDELSATVDLLQSDLIRELQLTEDFAEIQETKQDLMSASEDAPIVRLSNSMPGLAIKQGASDIHIEPMESDVTIRFRIDGVLGSGAAAAEVPEDAMPVCHLEHGVTFRDADVVDHQAALRRSAHQGLARTQRVALWGTVLGVAQREHPCSSTRGQAADSYAIARPGSAWRSSSQPRWVSERCRSSWCRRRCRCSACRRPES